MVLVIAQFASAVAAFFCLYSTGFSLWTLLACLVAAAFAKASLSLMENRLVTDEEAESLMEVADYVLTDAHRRTPRKP